MIRRFRGNVLSLSSRLQVGQVDAEVTGRLETNILFVY